MSKYLDKVINEMSDYASMAGAEGAGSESCMGMKSAGTVGVAGRRNHDIKAYKMNDLLRGRNKAEEEESFEDPEMGSDEIGMGDADMDREGGNSVEGLKQFFTDNPSPASEDISQYAEENQMDMEQMRQAVYDLIQSLLDTGDDEAMDDEMGSEMDADGSEEMGSTDDEVEFSARM